MSQGREGLMLNVWTLSSREACVCSARLTSGNLFLPALSLNVTAWRAMLMELSAGRLVVGIIKVNKVLERQQVPSQQPTPAIPASALVTKSARTASMQSYSAELGPSWELNS